MSCDVRENSEKHETESLQELQAPFLQKDETSDQDINNISPDVSSKINASEDFMGQQTQLSPKETVNYDEEQSVAYLRSAEQREFYAQLVKGYNSRVKGRHHRRYSTRSSSSVSHYTNVHAVQDRNKYGPETILDLRAPLLYQREILGVDVEHITPYVSSRTGERHVYEQSVIEYKNVVTRQPHTSSGGPNNPIQQPTVVYIVHNSQPAEAPAYVPNYICLSLFVLCCCCPPIGLCALIVSICSQDDLTRGRRRQALKKANMSKYLNIAGISAAVTILITIFVLNFVLIKHTLNLY